MNNTDIINETAFWIFSLAWVSPFVVAIIIAIWRNNTAIPNTPGAYCSRDFTYKPWPWRLHIVAICIACNSWLWSPWVALISVKLYKANWNAVNYLSRPDTVIPVPGKTYSADAIPAEKP